MGLFGWFGRSRTLDQARDEIERELRRQVSSLQNELRDEREHYRKLLDDVYQKVLFERTGRLFPGTARQSQSFPLTPPSLTTASEAGQESPPAPGQPLPYSVMPDDPVRRPPDPTSPIRRGRMKPVAPPNLTTSVSGPTSG